MNDDAQKPQEPEQTQSQGPTAPEPPPAAPAATEPAPVALPDAEEGKAFAILSYVLSLIGIPFFLVPLIMRNNEFSLYHAKQCLLIWLAGVVLAVVSAPLMAVCIGVIIAPVGGVFLLVLCIMGLINATKLEAKPVPLIGKWAEDWFKGITKA